MEQVKSLFGAIRVYFREAVAELRKVVWPSWERTGKLTGIVLASVALVSVFLFVIDLALGFGAERLLGR